jgi:quinoprotein relay system zinc metallohydrolase 2
MRLERISLPLLLALHATAVVATAVAAPLPALEMTEVAPGNYVHYGSLEERSPANLGDQANIGFIVGEACVAVVDPGGSLAVGAALRAALRRVSDKPICYVIITHMHPDHFFGAAAFREDQAVVVGHENLPRALAMRARPYLNALRRDLGELAAGSEVIAPTRLVHDETVLDLGGRTIRLRAWPAAHTDNDLTVFDEATATLWVSDLLFVDHTPVVDGTITGFIEVLGRLESLDARRYVPGHGRSDRPWPAVLEPERSYLSLIVRETRAAIKGRRTIEEATDEVGLTERAHWVNFDAFHRRNVTTAYAELEWE